jgi:hypothetical protein
MTVESVLRAYWSAIDAADWEAMAAVLADAFTGDYPATGEHFDKDGFIRLNREYPGRWQAELLDLVSGGDRAVTRARVFNEGESHVVASFATVSADQITELVEVWAEEGVEPPADRRPA